MGDLATTGGGPALAAAGLPRIVVLRDGRKVEVRPPTIQDAIEILEGLPGGAAGDVADMSVVDTALLRWLPDPVLEVLMDMQGTTRGKWLQDLLFQGVDLASMRARAKRRMAKGTDEKKKSAPPRLDWRLALSDYCQIYNAGNPWVVYRTTPFPFFLAMLEVAGAASARDLMRWVEIEVIPHLGKQAQTFLDGLKKRAEDAPDEAREAFAPREVIERDRAELKARFGGGSP